MSDRGVRRGSPWLSIAVGIVTAVVGAIVWGALCNALEHKIGYAAVALGLLVGLGMARTASAWRPLPLLAAVVTLGGCVLGNVFVTAVAVGELTGEGTMSALHQLTGDLAFGRYMVQEGLEASDAVFWTLAAVVAAGLTARAVVVASRRGADRGRPATPTS